MAGPTVHASDGDVGGALDDPEAVVASGDVGVGDVDGAGGADVDAVSVGAVARGGDREVGGSDVGRECEGRVEAHAVKGSHPVDDHVLGFGEVKRLHRDDILAS